MSGLKTKASSLMAHILSSGYYSQRLQKLGEGNSSPGPGNKTVQDYQNFFTLQISSLNSGASHMLLGTWGLLPSHSEEFFSGPALDWPTRECLFTNETCVLASKDVRHNHGWFRLTLGL